MLPWRPSNQAQREPTPKEVCASRARGDVNSNLTAWTKPTLKQLRQGSIRGAEAAWKLKFLTLSFAWKKKCWDANRKVATLHYFLHYFLLLFWSLLMLHSPFSPFLLIKLSVQWHICRVHPMRTLTRCVYVGVCYVQVCLLSVTHSKAFHTENKEYKAPAWKNGRVLTTNFSKLSELIDRSRLW